MLTAVAAVLDRGFFNDLYCTVLARLQEPKILRRLPPALLSRFYEALGVCLSRSGRHAEAIACSQRLLSHSTRTSDMWGIGMAHINAGCALFYAGRPAEALVRYEQAADHARKTNDKILLGRALHNLAMSKVEENPEDADRLLKQSVRLKKSSGDETGLFGALLGFGAVEAERGRPKQALKWFRKAEKTARKWEHDYELCLALHNQATAHTECKEFAIALPLYREAQKIARERGMPGEVIRAMGGEAVALYRSGDFKQAEPIFRKLHELHLQAGDRERAVIACHDRGAMYLFQGDARSARQLFGESLALAKRHGIAEWIYRCLKDIAMSYLKAGQPQKALRSLKAAALSEAKARRLDHAARLWLDIADVEAGKPEPASVSVESLSKCRALLARVRSCPDELPAVYEGIYVRLWNGGHFSSALETLDEMAEAAAHVGAVEVQCRALDQKGVALQELGRHPEAERLHRKALGLARKIGNPVRIETSLNNLGELCRKTDRPKDACHYLLEAEKVAKHRGDYEAAISIAHNRALALQKNGRRRDALRLLERCRDKARQRRLWSEYTRALHGVADMAWENGHPGRAEKLYHAALREAQSRGIEEQVWQIQYNLGSLLRTSGRLADAVPYLEAASQTFDSVPEGCRLHVQLAECEEELGNIRGATAHWRKVAELAGAAEDRECVVDALSAVASLELRAKDPAAAEQTLQAALRCDTSPEQRAILLRQTFEAALARGDQKEAARSFTEACRFAKSHCLLDVFVDVHMMAGDHNWQEGAHEPATEAYALALATAFALPEDAAMRVGTHIYRKVMSLRIKRRNEALTRMEQHIVTLAGSPAEWKSRSKVARLLSWPLEFARRMTEAEKEGRKPSEEEMGKIVSELVDE